LNLPAAGAAQPAAVLEARLEPLAPDVFSLSGGPGHVPGRARSASHSTQGSLGPASLLPPATAATARDQRPVVIWEGRPGPAQPGFRSVQPSQPGKPRWRPALRRLARRRPVRRHRRVSWVIDLPGYHHPVQLVLGVGELPCAAALPRWFSSVTRPVESVPQAPFPPPMGITVRTGTGHRTIHGRAPPERARHARTDPKRGQMINRLRSAASTGATEYHPTGPIPDPPEPANSRMEPELSEAWLGAITRSGHDVLCLLNLGGNWYECGHGNGKPPTLVKPSCGPSALGGGGERHRALLIKRALGGCWPGAVWFLALVICCGRLCFRPIRDAAKNRRGEAEVRPGRGGNGHKGEQTLSEDPVQARPGLLRAERGDCRVHGASYRARGNCGGMVRVRR